MDITYLGEQLLPGNIGKFSVFTSFFFALASCIAYLFATQSNQQSLQNSWKRIGRITFGVHSLAVFGIIISLFYIIYNHLFEYQYAWQHSSLDLPLRYIFSCFWEGQEGSFLLWSFWHVVLGWILIYSAKKWESPVLSVLAVTQAFLASMLLGIFIGDYKIGSNPFLLLRDVMDAPIFSRPDYLSFVEDGNGLNPLLQNYWMTIHPPTLFLGFALTVVPFAFVIAGLWKRDYKGWVAPALPWSLAATLVLGVGILMGGAWAYESLTFGGFWAWDPVENASLVPWLILLGALHCMMIFKHTGHSLKLTMILFMLTFLLILYSTFLTRSGILGDTSVHSFTDLGMSGQLLFFMMFYVVLSGLFLVVNWKALPDNKKEEAISSREFWLFIGALVLTISAFQITFTTSIPVFNKFFPLMQGIPGIGQFFEKDLAPPVDVIKHYNSIQVWVAIIIAFLSAGVQFMRYKKSDIKKFAKQMAVSFVIALVISVLVIINFEITEPHYILLAFASVFAVAANAQYLFIVLKGKLKIGGASIAHIGFALILFGTLISNRNSEVISINKSGIDFGEAFDAKNKRENILLRKDDPVEMNNYVVTYVGDSVAGVNNYYKIHYKRTDDKDETFFLYPNAQINPRMGLVANPDTRHYLTKDIYTHVTSVPDKEAREKAAGTFELDTLLVGDTFYVAKAYGIVRAINPQPDNPSYERQEDDIAVGIDLELYTLDDRQFEAQPVYIIRNRTVIPVEDEIKDLGVTFMVDRIIPEKESVVIGVKQQDMDNDFVIMKAIMFPYINLLWLGCFVMAFGLIVSIVRRVKENKRLYKA